MYQANQREAPSSNCEKFCCSVQMRPLTYALGLILKDKGDPGARLGIRDGAEARSRERRSPA